MFKEDGTKIRKPKAFVAGIEKNGYNNPIFDADGNKIEDPSAFLAEMDNPDGDGDLPASSLAKGKGGGKKRKSENDEPPGEGALFKADGTHVRNPKAYIEGIQKNGYTDKLFTADGIEIDDPVEYMKLQGIEIAAKPAGPSAKRQKTGGIFKADGTPVRNPEAFVEGIKRRGYTEPLFDAAGTKVRDPVKYVEAMVQNGSGAKPKGLFPLMPMYGQAMMPPMMRQMMPRPMGAPMSATLFKADGTPIRNPEAYVKGIAERGYNDPVFDAKGVKIKDPVKYMKMDTSGGISYRTDQNRTSGGGSSSASGELTTQLFKADGTLIRKPKEYIAGIEKRGYKDPLFDASGTEIRNPVAYLNKAGSKETSSAARLKNMVSMMLGANKGGEGSGKPSLKLFKEDGTLIKNPERYVEGIKKNGYRDPIYTADGVKIKDPVAFLKMK